MSRTGEDRPTGGDRHRDDAPHRARDCIDVLVGDWDTLGSRAAAIRQAVFVVEQGISHALEWDGADAACVHALALDAQGRAVGTGRLLPQARIGRMAVLAEARAAGVGSAILERLVEAARSRGHASVELSAQRTAEAFYRRHGFEAVGDPYEEAGIDHVKMRRAL